MSAFEMFTVCWNTKDFPNQFVVRRWQVSKFEPLPKEVIAIGRTLEEVREKIPPGLFRQPRWEADDPCIVENWF